MDPVWERVVDNHIVELRNRLHPIDLLPHLNCLTKSDKERIERVNDREGKQKATGTLLDFLQRRENWFFQFISALQKEKFEDLATLLQNEARSKRAHLIADHSSIPPASSHTTNLRHDTTERTSIHITNSNVQLHLDRTKADSRSPSADIVTEYDVQEDTAEPSLHSASNMYTATDTVVASHTLTVAQQTNVANSREGSLVDEGADRSSSKPSHASISVSDIDPCSSKEMSPKQHLSTTTRSMSSVQPGDDDYMLRSYDSNDSETSLKKFLPPTSLPQDFAAVRCSLNGIHSQEQKKHDDNEITDTNTNIGDRFKSVSHSHYSGAEQAVPANNSDSGNKSCESVSYPHYSDPGPVKPANNCNSGDRSYESVSYPRINDTERSKTINYDSEEKSCESAFNPHFIGPEEAEPSNCNTVSSNITSLEVCVSGTEGTDLASLNMNSLKAIPNKQTCIAGKILEPSSTLSNASIQPLPENTLSCSTNDSDSMLNIPPASEALENKFDSTATSLSELKLIENERGATVKGIENLDVTPQGVVGSSVLQNSHRHVRLFGTFAAVFLVGLLCVTIYKRS